MKPRAVFITGGYLGRRLVSRLIQRGHGVRALVRKDSEAKLPKECTPIAGNALDRTSFVEQTAGICIVEVPDIRRLGGKPRLPCLMA